MKNRRIILSLLLSILLVLLICACSDNSGGNKKESTASTTTTVDETTQPDAEVKNSISYKIDKTSRVLYIMGKGAIYQQEWIDFDTSESIELDKIIISRGATLIGDYAFDNGSNGLSEEGRNGFDKVQEVKIPNTVTQIGKEAFHNLISLNSVTIPNTVTWIGEGAFSECISLKKVELSSKLEELPKESFYHCKSLKEITIPMSVKAIADDAFLFTNKLTIKGYKGTAAEKYATDNGFKFISLG
ncbi:MAG: leucine-rich repeat domain-containing protein [Ruminococcus sp.]|nr:leucine-rich repeat domain-containing protein [Ruminococcus sp.]